MDLVRLLATGQSLRETALALAGAGLRVFPCAPGAKTPLTGNGFRDATTDRRRVAGWWRWQPEANIGLATGGAGVDVVDVDRHRSGSGFAALGRARRAGLVDGWACMVRTPSGGLHLYYPADPGRPQRSWQVGEAHVDFRGTGGYVVVPPSLVAAPSGAVGGYRLIATGHEPRPVDAVALRGLISPERPQHRPAVGGGPSRGGPLRGGERIAEWLAARPDGTRNSALFWAACRYAEGAVAEDRAHDVLGAAAEQAGLAPVEAAATIRSAYRNVAVYGPRRRASSGLAL